MSGDRDESLELNKVKDLLSQLSLLVVIEKDDENRNPPSSSSSSLSEEGAGLGAGTSTVSSAQLNQILQTFQDQNKNVNIHAIFDLITPHLFYKCSATESEMDVDSNAASSASASASSFITLSQSEALQTLVAIVSSNPEKYNLSAITSILKYIQNESTLNPGDVTSAALQNKEFNLTFAFLQTITQQVQHPSTEIANSASKILSLLSSQIPSSPQQREITSTILLLLHVNVETNVNQLTKGNQNMKSNHQNKIHVDPSILFIRNISLIVDILIPTANTNTFLHISTLMSSSLSSNDSNPLLSTGAITSRTESTTETILDPIATLMNHNQNTNTSGGRDPLLIMNIFEILEKITPSTNAVLQSWIENNMLQTLLSQVGFHLIGNPGGISGATLVQNSDIDVFNYIAALTILSKCCASAHPHQILTLDTAMMAQQEQQVLSSDMMMIIFQHILNSCIEESRDNSEKIRYIGAITNFITDERHGDNDERLKLFMKEGNVIKFWFNLKQGNSEYKAAVLHSLAQVLSCKEEGYGDDDNGKTSCLSNDMCTALHNIVGHLNGQTLAMELYMAQMKSSIDEIRLATYEVIKATIINRRKSLGIAQIVGHDGFLKLLLTRNVDSTNEGKDLKYAIVQGILESDMKGLLSASIVQSLEKYVEQGPYYIDASSGDIMIE